MGSNRFMVVSEKRGIIAMNPSYVEQKGKSLIIYMPGTYKQLEMEYKTEENARIAFAEIQCVLIGILVALAYVLIRLGGRV
jgi:hypothetical protein|nr:MAG TPA: hypothetical protein [Caudoviricetes sp.]